jgi:hypothetical protein
MSNSSPLLNQSRSVNNCVSHGASVGSAADRHRGPATLTGRTAWTYDHASPTSGDNSVDCCPVGGGTIAPARWTTGPSLGDRRGTTGPQIDPSTGQGFCPPPVPGLHPQEDTPSQLRRRRQSTLCTGAVTATGDLFKRTTTTTTLWMNEPRTAPSAGHGWAASHQTQADVTPGRARLYGEPTDLDRAGCSPPGPCTGTKPPVPPSGRNPVTAGERSPSP